MQKGPIYAIVVSIIALLAIYFFTDIKKNNKEKIASNGISMEVDNSSIEAYNKSLNQADLEKVNLLLEKALNENSKEAVDELIVFYENKEQYNFAAYYHTLKASIYGTAESWALAGERQLSVSKNEAYDANFNQILFDQALASLQKAVDLAPNNLEFQVKLGSAIVDNSPQPMQGITLLLGVIEKDSMHINANLALGKFGIISSQFDKAIIRLEKVLSLQPENTEALFLAAEAYANLGNKEAAIASLEKCRQLVENEDLKKEIDNYLQQLLLQ
jgi:Flp pilus assembly protein TadD